MEKQLAWFAGAWVFQQTFLRLNLFDVLGFNAGFRDFNVQHGLTPQNS
jgi:hypothetical protein